MTSGHGRTLMRIHNAIFGAATPERLVAVRAALALVIGARIALGPYRSLADQPDALFRPVGVVRLLGLSGIPSVWAIAALQVVGVAGAVLVAARRWPRVGFAVGWMSLLVLAGFRSSRGKYLHNDTLLLVGAAPMVFAPLVRAVPDVPASSGTARRQWGWPVTVGLAAICLAYFVAGLSKLVASGLAWVFSDNMRYVMAAAVRSGKPMLPAIAEYAAERAWLSRAIAASILGFELMVPLALVWARSRPFFALTALGLHVGTWLTLGLDYWMWAATAVILLLGAPSACQRTSKALGENGGHGDGGRDAGDPLHRARGRPDRIPGLWRRRR